MTNFESSLLTFNLNFLKVEPKTEDALGGPPLVRLSKDKSQHLLVRPKFTSLKLLNRCNEVLITKIILA